MRCPELPASFHPTRPLGVPLTIFIAEDDKVAASSLADLLTEQGGVEVVGMANSEVAAADWLMNHTQETDVLITDLLLLPGGSGFGVIHHAKKFGAFRKVVVFSSFVTDAVAQKCRKLGADAVFQKSDIQALLEYVRELRPEQPA